MKHTLRVTLILIAVFLIAQLFGLFLIAKDANIVSMQKDGQTVLQVQHSDTAMGARPETTGAGSFIYLAIGIAVGTILVLILAKFKKSNIWRLWFFLAVWIALSISLGVVLDDGIFYQYDYAIFLALLLAIWKIYFPNPYVHNLTEILMYAGIALLLVPIFDVTWALVLLLAISLYDMYAVWKSKHMITMAKFQTESKIFAGLLVPYSVKSSDVANAIKNDDVPQVKSTKIKVSKNKQSFDKTTKIDLNVQPKNAILGGGDVVFPLIFAGAVMEKLLTSGLTKTSAYFESTIMVITTTIAIALLFFFAEKDKFYPAMPFVTAGCLFGWVITLII
jgi:presenilin-like A22 family membrane protease